MWSPTVGGGIFQRTAQLMQLVRESVVLTNRNRGTSVGGMAL